MKIKIPTQHISAIFLLIIFTSCMGILNKGHRSSEFLLLGSDINKVNESGGVVQASPGLENTPTTTNTTTSTENTSEGGVRGKHSLFPVINPCLDLSYMMIPYQRHLTTVMFT